MSLRPDWSEAKTSALLSTLSNSQRDLLLLHIDRAVDVRRDGGAKVHATLSLIRLGLIQGDVPGSRPKRTVLTEGGRFAVCLLLARYADALVRARCQDLRESLTPLAILRRMKEIGQEIGGPGRKRPFRADSQAPSPEE
jgi:hypothetical protein